MKKTHSALVKFKVALAALTGQPIIDICKQYEIGDGLVHKWKKELKERGAEVFASKIGNKDNSKKLEIEKLYQRIGQLSVEVDFLKKVVGE